MTDSPQWDGPCAYCSAPYAKEGMVRHLRVCPEREDAIAAATTDAPETLYHLRVDDEWAPPY